MFKKNNISPQWLLFILIIFFGLLFRIYLIFSRDIFTDEVFYTYVAINNSYREILNVNHWIKDHGIFYLLSLKFLTYFSQNIFYLRLFNLIPYLLTSFFLYRFFIIFDFGYLALVSVFLYSFLSYFVFIQSLVLPFNLVLLFSTIALISLITFIFSKKSTNSNLIIFTFSSILAFYSDYSSGYFFLSLIPVFFWMVVKEKKKFLAFISSGLTITIGVLPGVYFIINNLKSFSSLNSDTYLQSINFWQYLRLFSDIMIFRIGGSTSLLVLIAMLVTIFYIGMKSKKGFLKFISYFCLSTVIINVLFVYLFSKKFFFIFVERSFWHFYLIEIFSISIIFFFFKNKKIYLFILLLGTLLIMCTRLIDFRGSYFPGRIPDRNINYKSLADDIKKNYRNSQNINILYSDNGFTFVPLSQYYLKDYSSFKITKNNSTIVDKKKPSILIEFDQFERNTTEVFGKNPPVIYKIECDTKNCQFLKEK